MKRCTRASKLDQTEDAIRRAGSIGALERLAGIGGAAEDRAAFWQPFCKLPGAEGLDAGVPELKRIISSNRLLKKRGLVGEVGWLSKQIVRFRAISTVLRASEDR